jgi:hypothetical protein
MSAPLDDSEFIDRDFLASQSAPAAAGAVPLAATLAAAAHLPSGRPPNREELEARLTDKHQQLAELKRRQEVIERERVALEESRRRQAEFETGRPEIAQQLVRGVEMLEQAEFKARQEAEQMARTLAGLREALTNVQGIRQDAWTPETWQTELTRALTTIENARLEWSGARLKWPLLGGEGLEAAGAAGAKPGAQGLTHLLATRSLGEWFKLGLALTWPLALVALLALVMLTVVLLRP